MPCRLLDVQELLSDTGVGRQQHVIVSQGQLDAVLNARPEDRRLIIEEAAGVLKYRRRREKAQRRLESTESSLLRLQDLLREVRRQLRPLERQADAARRHGDLVAELRAVRRYLAGRELAAVEARLAAGRERRARAGRAEAERAGRAGRPRRRRPRRPRRELSAARRRDDGRRPGRRPVPGRGAAGPGQGSGRRARRAAPLGRAGPGRRRWTRTWSPAWRRRRPGWPSDLAGVDDRGGPAGAPGRRAGRGRGGAGRRARRGRGSDVAATRPGRPPDGAAAEVRGELVALRSGVDRAGGELRRLDDQPGVARPSGPTASAAEADQLRQAIARGRRGRAAADGGRRRRRRQAAGGRGGAGRRPRRPWRAADAEQHRWAARAEALALALDEARARAGAERLAEVDGVVGTLLELVEVDDGLGGGFEAAAGEAVCRRRRRRRRRRPPGARAAAPPGRGRRGAGPARAPASAGAVRRAVGRRPGRAGCGTTSGPGCPASSALLDRLLARRGGGRRRLAGGARPGAGPTPTWSW